MVYGLSETLISLEKKVPTRTRTLGAIPRRSYAGEPGGALSKPPLDADKPDRGMVDISITRLSAKRTPSVHLQCYPPPCRLISRLPSGVRLIRRTPDRQVQARAVPLNETMCWFGWVQQITETQFSCCRSWWRRDPDYPVPTSIPPLGRDTRVLAPKRAGGNAIYIYDARLHLNNQFAALPFP